MLRIQRFPLPLNWIQARIFDHILKINIRFQINLYKIPFRVKLSIAFQIKFLFLLTVTLIFLSRPSLGENFYFKILQKHKDLLLLQLNMLTSALIIEKSFILVSRFKYKYCVFQNFLKQILNLKRWNFVMIEMHLDFGIH